MATKFSYLRGAPISIDIVANDAGGYDLATLAVLMRMKRTTGLVTPPRSADVVATPQVAFHPVAGQAAAFWRGSLTAAISADLEPGTYAVDAQISQGGTVLDVSQPVFVEIVESITPA